MNWDSTTGRIRRYWTSLGLGVRTALALCVLGFVLQGVVERAPIQAVYQASDGTLWALPDPVALLFAVHGRGLALGFFWTPVTYMFLHGSWTHLLLNAIGLLVMGNAVEALLGIRRFWTVFLLSGVVGGIGWALAQGLGSNVPCVGASAGVLGLVGAYAALRPHDRFLLVFPIPITLSAKALALWLAVANAIDLAFGHSNVAYLAHLVGIVTGALYGLALRRGGLHLGDWLAARFAFLRPKPRTLDDVLAKIQRRGRQSLNARDRRILDDEARRLSGGNPPGGWR